MPWSFSRSSPFLTCRFLSQCVTLSQTRFVTSNTWQHKWRDHREHGKHCNVSPWSSFLPPLSVGLNSRPVGPCSSRQGDMRNWFLLYSCRNLSNSEGFLLPESSQWLNDWLNFYSAAAESVSAGQYQPNVSACVDDLAHVFAEHAGVWFILECCTVPGSSLGTLWGFNGREATNMWVCLFLHVCNTFAWQKEFFFSKCLLYGLCVGFYERVLARMKGKVAKMMVERRSYMVQRWRQWGKDRRWSWR